MKKIKDKSEENPNEFSNILKNYTYFLRFTQGGIAVSHGLINPESHWLK